MIQKKKQQPTNKHKKFSEAVHFYVIITTSKHVRMNFWAGLEGSIKQVQIVALR